MKNSAAKIRVMFGDARIELNKVPRGYYDLLIIDAFTGDSIPVHLLTTEAILEYKEHMREGGIILFHISNRYLDLAPVLFANAAEVNSRASLNGDELYRGRIFWPSDWVAMTWDKDKDDTLASKLNWVKKRAGFPGRKSRPWSDAYSNILSVFKTKEIVDEIKNFIIFYNS